MQEVLITYEVKALLARLRVWFTPVHPSRVIALYGQAKVYTRNQGCYQPLYDSAESRDWHGPIGTLFFANRGKHFGASGWRRMGLSGFRGENDTPRTQSGSVIRDATTTASNRLIQKHNRSSCLPRHHPANYHTTRQPRNRNSSKSIETNHTRSIIFRVGQIGLPIT